MKILKRLLMLAVILAVVLAAGAFAAESAYPEPFAGKVVKIALDSGYQLSTTDRGEYVTISGVGLSSELEQDAGYVVDYVPVYSVSVPNGTENVYFYILQDPDSNGGYFSYYGNYYMGIADWNQEDGTAAMEWYDEDKYWIFQEMSYGNDLTNICVDLENGVVAGLAEGGNETSLYKLTVPVPDQNTEDGSTRLVVFETENSEDYTITFPFALNFVEKSGMDVSTVATDYVNVYDVTKWDATKAGEETKEITAEIFPKGAVKDASSIIWRSGDESIVTIESTGKTEYEASYDSINATAILTPHKVGETTITVSCGNYTATCNVEITAVNASEEATIELDKSEAAIWNIADQTVPEGYAEQYPGTVALNAVVTPEDTEIVWTSSDETVATVANGVVTPVGAGEAVITATAGDASAQCAVTVNAYVEQGYTNFTVLDWTDSANKPENVTAKVIDLSDASQPKQAKIEAAVYKNVDGVKTLSTIQDVKWQVTGRSECAAISYEGNTATLNFTETTGSITVWPTTLADSKNGGAVFYVTEGFTISNEIVRADGEEWTYGTATVGGVERTDVIQLYEGAEVVVKNEQLPYGNNPDYHVWSLYNYAVNGNTVIASSWNRDAMTLTAKQAGFSRLTVWSPNYERDYDWNTNGSNLPSDQRVSTTVYIQVLEKVDVESVSLNESEAIVWNIAGQAVPEGYEEQYPETVTLSATVSPENAMDKTVTWISSDETVATVVDGVVTPVGAGNAIITATAGEASAQCAVTVNAYVEQAYTNVAAEGWIDSVNKPEGVTAKVIDLSDENQPKTVKVIGYAYKNVEDVKALSTIQDCTWNVTGDTGCVTYTTEGNTITLTFTGETGKVTVQPVLLNGYKNASMPIYVTEGFADTVTIAREDGKAWETESMTIGSAEYEVIQITEGDAITAVANLQPYENTADYHGWLLATLNDSGATVSTKGSNGAGLDLSTFSTGLYRLTVRVPQYEYKYNIDPSGTQKQPTIAATVYIQVNEAPEIKLGDVDGSGTVNSTDARSILNFVSGNVTPSEDQLAAADINGDGDVTSTDARRIMLYISGHIEELG